MDVIEQDRHCSEAGSESGYSTDSTQRLSAASTCTSTNLDDIPEAMEQDNPKAIRPVSLSPTLELCGFFRSAWQKPADIALNKDIDTQHQLMMSHEPVPLPPSRPPAPGPQYETMQRALCRSKRQHDDVVDDEPKTNSRLDDHASKFQLYD